MCLLGELRHSNPGLRYVNSFDAYVVDDVEEENEAVCIVVDIGHHAFGMRNAKFASLKLNDINFAIQY